MSKKTRIKTVIGPDGIELWYKTESMDDFEKAEGVLVDWEGTFTYNPAKKAIDFDGKGDFLKLPTIDLSDDL